MIEFTHSGNRMDSCARLSRFQQRTERQRLRKGYETAVSNVEKDAAMLAIIQHLESQPVLN